MKIIIRSFLIAFTVLLLNSQIFSEGFNSVFSKDGSDVLAVGNDTLFRSFDGGDTWIISQVSGLRLNSVYAINHKIWIAANPASVYFSTNNGFSWSTVNVAGMTELHGIFFIDENTGWVCGNNGVAKTVNGGAAWTMQTVPVSVRYNSIKFISSAIGVACGNSGTVITTINGGTTWVISITPIINNILSIDRKSNTIIASASDGLAILLQINGGRRWRVINYKIITKSDITGISIIDNNTFYSCGGGGFIRKSTDAGATFQFQLNPMMANLSGIYFYDSNKGWAVSSLNKAVIRTTDGGNTWLLPSNTTVTYTWNRKMSTSGNIGNDFCLHPTNKKCIFCCGGTWVYRSLDVGETWTHIATISFSGEANSFYVSPKDTNLMLACLGSSGGRVIRSTDYGQTWTITWGPGSITTYGMPLEMNPNHPDTILLAPNGSVVLRSTDFGLTWNNWGNTIFSDPCDMAALYNSNVVYMGDQNGGGKFYKSTDAGITWNLLINAGGSEIPMIGISNFDNNLAYFTNWGGSGFRKTTDQGINWTQVIYANSSWGTDIAKDDPNVTVFGTYGLGTTFISTNAGANFVSQSIGGSGNYGMLAYDRGTLFSQQSDGIYKLFVDYIVPAVTGNHQISSETPKEFALSQNYPNPFNPSTLIKYDIPKTSYVSIKVYDINGKLVQTLVNTLLNAGKYSINFDGSNLSSGMYFYKIEAGSFAFSKKMALIK